MRTKEERRAALAAEAEARVARVAGYRVQTTDPRDPNSISQPLEPGCPHCEISNSMMTVPGVGNRRYCPWHKPKPAKHVDLNMQAHNLRLRGGR